MSKPCIVIPVYEHEGAMPGVLKSLKRFKLPCLMVDDGSSAACASALRNLAKRQGKWVSLIRLPQNQGKGAAVMAGCRAAFQRGYTHAIQIDADGQHTASDLPRFLAASKAEPLAAICGSPVFDASIPAIRLYGRMITNSLIKLHALSLGLEDGMCGFRLYPLAALMRVLDREDPGKRMDFDPEILVRLRWQGLKLAFLPTKVSYPTDGRSHFLMGLDNLLITRMHFRLFFGMLWRSPWILWRRLAGAAP